MKPNFILRSLLKQKSSAGFSLIELLTALIITAIVVGAAGFGLVHTLRVTKTGNAQTERRSEVARAYDFISDEIRKSESVLSTVDPTYASNTNLDDASKEVVLALKIPGLSDPGNAGDSSVVYYVENPPSGSVWQGPKVLYRWGPPLDSSGNYTTGTWQGKPLIDQVDDLNDTTNNLCESGWTETDVPGVTSCVDSSNKTAQLFINGNIATSFGSGKGIYGADTRTVARANTAPTINDVNSPNRIDALGGQASCNKNASPPIPWDMQTEFVVYEKNKDTTVAIETDSSDPSKPNHLREGGSFDLNTSDLSIGKNQKVSITSRPILPSGVTGVTSSPPFTADKCIVINDSSPPQNNPPTIDFKIDNSGNINVSNDSGGRVKIYKNNSTVNHLDTLVYENQDNSKQFLEDRGINFVGVDTDSDGTDDYFKVQLLPNQVLIAFETGNTDPTAKGFDLQDSFVLVTLATDLPNAASINYPSP